jgi:hypothetical protein
VPGKDLILIFIDTCAWDLLFAWQVDLLTEFPPDQFKIMMTKEVYSFELLGIPARKTQLTDYIRQQIEKCRITEDAIFGFTHYKSDPRFEPRVSGFGLGRLITYQEGAHMQQFFGHQGGSTRPTGLKKNEADASLAVRAMGGSIVLTAEDSSTSGPLKDASKLYGKVVYLKDFPSSVLSLRDFVLGGSPDI